MVKVDVASMAHGLESRSPLLDHVLMEWAAEIPAELRMARGVTKALFKSAWSRICRLSCSTARKWASARQLTSGYAVNLKELAYDTLLSQPRLSVVCSVVNMSSACSVNILALYAIIITACGYF